MQTCTEYVVLNVNGITPTGRFIDSYFVATVATAIARMHFVAGFGNRHTNLGIVRSASKSEIRKFVKTGQCSWGI